MLTSVPELYLNCASYCDEESLIMSFSASVLDASSALILYEDRIAERTNGYFHVYKNDDVMTATLNLVVPFVCKQCVPTPPPTHGYRGKIDET